MQCKGHTFALNEIWEIIGMFPELREVISNWDYHRIIVTLIFEQSLGFGGPGWYEPVHKRDKLLDTHIYICIHIEVS